MSEAQKTNSQTSSISTLSVEQLKEVYELKRSAWVGALQPCGWQSTETYSANIKKARAEMDSALDALIAGVRAESQQKVEQLKHNNHVQVGSIEYFAGGYTAMKERAELAEASLTTAQQELDELKQLVRKALAWIDATCPCEDGLPDPCTLCGAKPDGVCGVSEVTLPTGLRHRLEQSLLLQTRSEAVNDGNLFIFCDHVERVDALDHRGCLRGAGHDGPHVFLQRNMPVPLAPVVLQTRSERSQETKTEEVSRATLQPQLRAGESDPRGDQRDGSWQPMDVDPFEISSEEAKRRSLHPYPRSIVRHSFPTVCHECKRTIRANAWHDHPPSPPQET